MRNVHNLTKIVASLPSGYAAKLLSLSNLQIPAWSLLQDLQPQTAATLLRQSYGVEEAVGLLEKMWTSKSYIILNYLDIEYFSTLADRLTDNRLAELLEHRSAQAREYLTTRSTAQRAAKLLSLMDPQQGNWLLDNVSDKDILRIFSAMNITERVNYYVVDPAKYDYVTEALGDGPGMGWQQNDALLEVFAGILAAEEPSRADAALRAADWSWRQISSHSCRQERLPGSAFRLRISQRQHAGIHLLSHAARDRRPNNRKCSTRLGSGMF